MEAAIKELHGYHSKDKLKEHVDDENVEDVLEGRHDAVKDGLQLRDSFDGFEGPEDAKDTERLDDAQTTGGALGPGTCVAARK